MNKLILIAAIGKNNELGRDNDLIWHIKGDMKFFKEHTSNHHIVMGKNTFYSLPKLLPNRKHIVITSNDIDLGSDVVVLHSLDEFYNYAKDINDDIYVIGGASIYKQTIDNADELYITKIEDSCKDADVYFPNIDTNYFDCEVLEEHKENDPKYSHVLYKRKHR